ncbi:hypothetical protein B9Z55_023880 [Caenorhabditis nigoni]|uniref:Uncharacterized protein n=1 Tax=Caenorhabditis nigoni TaxID=1611254 RepID=A0A2G5SS43_9PELO|nr:hypothetical protein B9Z55_023880 [Caenorhabditis nigoni]
MRLFVKKTNQMDQEGASDSPYFDFTDFSLRKGSNECQKFEFPLIGRIEKMKGLRARRVKECKEISPLRLTNPAYSYTVGWQGNILGRFWYLREEGSFRHQEIRLQCGLWDRYTENELAEYYDLFAKISKTDFSRYPLFIGENLKEATFFQNLAAYTSTTYDVCWIAQDWLDGLELFDTKNSTGQT